MSNVRAAIYARVSTLDQNPDNQIEELQRFTAARGWDATTYTDHGVSGSKERRPALDVMVADAKRRRFDVIVVWRLDRLGRNLKHLITLIDETTALGIAFVSGAEGIDATTPAGKLQLHILAIGVVVLAPFVGVKMIVSSSTHVPPRPAGRRQLIAGFAVSINCRFWVSAEA